MTDRFKRGGRDFFETRWGYAVVTFVIVVIVFTLLILTGWLKPDRGATSGSRSPSPILLIRFLVFLVLIPLRFLWSRSLQEITKNEFDCVFASETNVGQLLRMRVFAFDVHGRPQAR